MYTPRNEPCCGNTHLHGSGPFTMLRTYFFSAGSTRRAMVEHDLVHIENVLLRASSHVLDSTVLPPVYWRERLRQIRDGGQLLESHLAKINALLLVLDRWLTSEPGSGRTALGRTGVTWDAARQAKKDPA